MSSANNTPADLEAIFDGVPVVVRLVNDDDILCVLYQSTLPDDERMFMERPLRVVVDEVDSDLQESPTHQRTQVMYSQVRTRFDRWMAFTSATMFPVYTDHILSIAPLADRYIQSYVSWADQLYELYTEPTSSLTERETPSTEDIRRSYIDFLLHNFHPKGKPH